MGCQPSKPKPLLGKHIDFTDKHVEEYDTHIESFHVLLRDLMVAATTDPSTAGWQERPCPEVAGLQLFFAYHETEKGPLVVTSYHLEGVCPDALFRFLSSVDGKKVIDPDTKNHDRPPVEVPTWRDRCEVTHAVVPRMLMLSPRTFMVLNAFDSVERLFISVPVLHHKHPKEEEEAKKIIRARNVWASWVQPTPGGARMVSFNWLDLHGDFPAFLTDTVMIDQFMQKFHLRLIKAVDARPELKLDTNKLQQQQEQQGQLKQEQQQEQEQLQESAAGLAVAPQQVLVAA